MEKINLADGLPEVSRVALGTWAIGGWLWGGADDENSIQTILAAIERGINCIDTAPVYGFGRAELVVGKAIAHLGKKKRQDLVVATKAGLEWTKDEKVFRNCAAKRLEIELEESLRRLQVDYIDLYQVHWPDLQVPVQETAQVMRRFLDSGKVRAIGVSNYTPQQMTQFQEYCPIVANQPPYNLFERGIETDILPYCEANNIATLAYGAICRGLLSGRMTAQTAFPKDDLRSFDPKFQGTRYQEYLTAVQQLGELADERYGKKVIELAVRWVLDQGKTVALWGARRPDQLAAVDGISGWQLTQKDLQDIDQILGETVKNPIGPEFMSSPDRSSPNYNGAYPL